MYRLSVMIFTGFQLGKIRQRNLPGVEYLLSHTDVVVDGPFVAARRDTRRNWVGSENQRFHYLTQRYDASIETSSNGRHAVEFRIGLDDRLEINGITVLSLALQTLSVLAIAVVQDKAVTNCHHHGKVPA